MDDLNEMIDSMPPEEYEELIIILSHELDFKFGPVLPRESNNE